MENCCLLVHASITYEVNRPDGSRRRVQVEKRFDVEIEISLEALSFTWSPSDETPGKFRKRAMAEIGKNSIKQ